LGKVLKPRVSVSDLIFESYEVALPDFSIASDALGKPLSDVPPPVQMVFPLDRAKVELYPIVHRLGTVSLNKSGRHLNPFPIHQVGNPYYFYSIRFFVGHLHHSIEGWGNILLSVNNLCLIKQTRGLYVNIIHAQEKGTTTRCRDARKYMEFLTTATQRLTISVRTACNLADVSEQLIRRELREGRIKFVKTSPGVGGKVLIEYASFLRWLGLNDTDPN
jgi:excisionase family DNA binding protein